MAAGDGGPRWLVNQHIEVSKFTRTSPSFGAYPQFPRAWTSRLERQNLGSNQRMSGRSTTAIPASNTRLPTTLDHTNLARDGGGGTDGGGSRSDGRQSRLIHHRQKVSPLGSARYTSSRRRQAALKASSHAESSDGFCLFGSKIAEIR
jgi:hypothetical protein